MIEDKLHNLHTIHLPEEARIRMRSELLAYAELHAPLSAPVRSSFFPTFSMRMYSGLAIAALLIVGLGGTAYASGNALPGDLLYPVKVGVTEPIQTALVPSERGKASWNAILAERRLEEAAQLAANNKLTPAVQTQLAANFTEHVMASEKHAARLESTGDTTGSLSVQSDLEARLTAHEQILGVIAAHYALASSTSAEGTETEGALTQLLATIRDHQTTIVSTRVALEDAIAPQLANTSGSVRAEKISARSTPEIAIAHVIHLRAGIPPAARIANADTARSEEVSTILVQHAALLAKFLPTSTTTASTTASSTETMASTTASTTSETSTKNLEKIDTNEIKP